VRSGSRIPERIRIRYRRPPDREQLFQQKLVAREEGVVVTLIERAPVTRPSVIDGAVALESGSPIVWLSFPGAWHDVGRFHRADGTFTGLYANVLTPVEGLDGSDWTTTDLFLDVWIPAAGGAAHILDEDELAAALECGWVDDATARRARAEARTLVEAAATGAWPPRSAHEWTLERARATLRHPRAADG
jgi:predicted RNA-binding protein associated with RNAse of E/G family